MRPPGMDDAQRSLQPRPSRHVRADHSIAEMFVRGTIMYFVLLALLRFIRNRQSSGLGVTDVLVIVLIADAAQNGMAKEYRSVTEGAALVGTIIGWDYALDWLSYRFPGVQRLIHP